MNALPLRLVLGCLAVLVSPACGSSSGASDSGPRADTGAQAADTGAQGADTGASQSNSGTVCTCLTPADWNLSGSNTCDGPSIQVGCREAPKPFQGVLDRPPQCWQSTKTDPDTGCLIPDLSPVCAFSCRPQDGGMADAGAPDTGVAEDAGAGRVCGARTCAASEVCCAATGPGGDQCAAPNACASVRCEGPEHCTGGTLCCTDGIQSTCQDQGSCFDRACRTGADCPGGQMCCPFGAGQNACRPAC